MKALISALLLTLAIGPTLSWAHGSHDHSDDEASDYHEHEEKGIAMCDSPPCVDSPFFDLNGNGVIEIEEATSENIAYCDKNFNGLIDADEEVLDNIDCSKHLGEGQSIFATRPIARLGLGKGQLLLTIDDGPNRKITGSILDLLQKYNIKAAFFLTGNRIATNADLVRRMYNEGHTVGNHTFTHAVRVSPENLRGEIIRAHQEIAAVLGGEPEGRLLFRAPGLAWSTPKAVTLNQDSFTRNYIGPIHANLGADAPKADWSCWSKKRSAQQCADWYFQDIVNAGRGIVLTHDVFYNGTTRNTYEMLKILLAKLDAAGGIKNRSGQGVWSFVDIQDVAGLDQFDAGGGGAPPKMPFSNGNYRVRSKQLLVDNEISDSSIITLSNGASLKTGDITEFQDLEQQYKIGNTTFRKVRIVSVRSERMAQVVGEEVLIGAGAF